MDGGEFAEMMDGHVALKMLEEVAQQDDIRVAKVLRMRWDQENDENFLWSVNNCFACDTPHREGEIGFIWGKPVNTDRDCTMLSMVAICSEECVDRCMEAWAAAVETDVMTAYFTENI